MKKNNFMTKKIARAFSFTLFFLMVFAAPTTAYSNNAGQAPQYQFETTFSCDQWGRPTTSSVAPQHTQNIRRDRHAAFLPPSNGSDTGFYSGEFPTGQVNPFAPRYNNNSDASRAVAIEESVIALRLGEAGVNVRADGSHSGGFLASTSVILSGGINNSREQSSVESGDGFSIAHRPLTVSPQSSNQQNRITTVTPFDDGTIGRITIPALNNRMASVRPGVELSTLNNYVGHFSHTSQWDGNIALASHNRGRGNFFADIWTLQIGDRIFYETTVGARVYEVVSIKQISETDLSYLNHSHENILTLITCVIGQSSLRWCVRAREVT
jgi:LPXTG-site transpeptidase (sortase) family protein